MEKVVQGTFYALVFTTACGVERAEPHLDGYPDQAQQELLSATWWDGVQGRIESERAAIRQGAEGLEAAMPAVDRTAHFDVGGVHLSSNSGEPTLSLETVGFGRDGAVAALAPVTPQLGACGETEGVDGRCLRRLEYTRDGITEWWLGLSDGLEQGWTVQRSPAGFGPLVFEVEVRDALTVDQLGADAELTDAKGQAWSASDVVAWDASGIYLPSRLEVRDHSLVVMVDDAGATYPVTVDPVYSTATWRFIGDDAGYMGQVVAAAGDVNGDGYPDVLVGCPFSGLDTGSAYLYLGSSSGLADYPDSHSYLPLLIDQEYTASILNKTITERD